MPAIDRWTLSVQLDCMPVSLPLADSSGLKAVGHLVSYLKGMPQTQNMEECGQGGSEENKRGLRWGPTASTGPA